MNRTEDDVRPQAIENVVESDVAKDLMHRYLNGAIAMQEYCTELDELLDTEVEYLLSDEYAREERRAREIDDARSA